MKMKARKTLEFLGVAAFMFVIGMGAYAFTNLGVFNNIENAINIFRGLEWFVGSFALATLFTAYLVVVADMRFVFRFLAIPAWLAFAFTLLMALDQFMGYAYPSLPPESKLLSYRVIRDPDTNVRIVEAWMYLPKENKTRAYTFPFNRNQEEALYRAKRKGARGQDVKVKLLPEKEGMKKKDRPQPEDMIMHDIKHKGLPEKDYGSAGTMQQGVTTDQKDVDDMGSERKSDKIQITLPDGGHIELNPGESFRITPEGEIEILDPGAIKQKQIKSRTSTPTPSATDTVSSNTGPPEGIGPNQCPLGNCAAVMGTTVDVPLGPVVDYPGQ